MLTEFFSQLKLLKPAQIKNFKEWAREKAVMLDPLDGHNTDIEKLSFLDDLLANKRIVYLGEEDHWIHEKTEYRILMLRYLFSRGWRYIGEELGWSDGIRIDKYLEDGDASNLDKIATYGYSGDARNDREDKPTGILKGLSDSYPLVEFRNEQIRFAKAMRNINASCSAESGRLRFFGFDINAEAGGGYKDILDLLEPAAHLEPVAEIRKLLERVQRETIEQEIERINHLFAEVGLKQGVLEKILGENRCGMLIQSIRTLRGSLEYFRISNPAADYNELNKAMAVREEAMLQNVIFILSQMDSKDKLILMGHNRHLSKKIESIKKLGASPPGGKIVPSVGTMLNRMLPGQVFSIWMLQHHGRSSQPFTGLSSEYTDKPGSLNSILSDIGSAYIFSTDTEDKRACMLKSNMNIVGLYNMVFRTAISKQADAIFFVDEVTPMR